MKINADQTKSKENNTKTREVRRDAEGKPFQSGFAKFNVFGHGRDG
jgi:hypothetical protein